MRAAYLDDAEPAAVSHAVRDVLERRGALIREHVSSRILFSTRPSRAVWERAGYVGIFQHLGEKEVEVRLLLRANWPACILWTVGLVDVIIAILTFIVNPSGTTWFVLAFLTGFALLLAGLVHLNTLRSVREEERVLMEDIDAELTKDHIGKSLETREDRELHALEAELAGEVERLKVERERKAAPAKEKPRKVEKPAKVGGGMRLSFKKRPADAEQDAPTETPEEKRARLLARKAELEAEGRDKVE